MINLFDVIYKIFTQIFVQIFFSKL